MIQPKKVLTGLAAIIVAAGSLLVLPQSLSAVSQTDQINDYVKKSLDQYDIPGASAIVQKDGKTLIDNSWGETSNGDKVTTDTPFLIGSLSKSITAAAIMMLVQDGKIDLDESINQSIPGFRYESIDGTQITVRQLLEQTSGIGPMDGLNVTDRDYPEKSGITKAVTQLQNVKLLSKPGTEYRYTSANYLLLGAIIQSDQDNQTYADFLEKRLFGPLKMTTTSATKDDSLLDGLRAGNDSWLGYPVSGRGFYDNAGAPYGYITSTANDMTKFLKFMQDGGGILDQQHLQLLKQVPTGDRTYGIGWHYSKDGNYFYHGGATPGFRAEMFYYPDRDFSGIILTNKYHSLEDQQVSDIMAGIRAIADGQSPAMLPAADRSIQFGMAGALLALFVTLALVVTRYFQYRSRSRVWKKVVGVMLTVIAVGFAFAVPYIFGAPWHSVFLFAADVGYMSIGLSILLVCNGLALFMSQRHVTPSKQPLPSKK